MTEKDFLSDSDLFEATSPFRDLPLFVTFAFGERYGARWGFKKHVGTDFRTKNKKDFPDGIGREVYPVADGVYDGVGFNPRGGNYVRIKHKGGFLSKYFHLDSYTFENGWSRIYTKNCLGLSGMTGSQLDGAHVHIELWKDGKPVDLMKYMGRRKTREEIIFLNKMLTKKINDYFTISSSAV